MQKVKILKGVTCAMILNGVYQKYKIVSSEAKMQRVMYQVLQSLHVITTISTKKTVVLHHLTPRKPYKEPTIAVYVQKLNVVDKFTSHQGSAHW